MGERRSDARGRWPPDRRAASLTTSRSGGDRQAGGSSCWACRETSPSVGGRGAERPQLAQKAHGRHHRRNAGCRCVAPKRGQRRAEVAAVGERTKACPQPKTRLTTVGAGDRHQPSHAKHQLADGKTPRHQDVAVGSGGRRGQSAGCDGKRRADRNPRHGERTNDTPSRRLAHATNVAVPSATLPQER
jgi:hypothetical protein